MELESWPKSLFSGLARLFSSRSTKPPIPLREMRLGIAWYVLMLLVLLVVYAVAGGERPRFDPVFWGIFATVEIALVALTVIAHRTGTRKVLAARTTGAADREYTTRFWKAVNFAFCVALIGTVATGRSRAPYLIALPVSLILIAWVAPREQDIENIQQRLDEIGSTIDLAGALTSPRTWSWRDDDDQPRLLGRR